jgi:hypothetical protein
MLPVLFTMMLATCCVVRSDELTDRRPATHHWHKPPQGKPMRRTPRLVNYCHIPRELTQYSARELEDMLAQWDVIVLFLERDHVDCSVNLTSRRHIVPPQDGRILKLTDDDSN